MVELAVKPEELVYARGLLAAESIAQELRARLVRRIARERLRPNGELIALARDTLAEFEPLLAATLADTDLAAWVTGVDRVAEILPFEGLEQFEAQSRLIAPPEVPPSPPRFTFPSAMGDEGEPIVRFPAIEEAAESLMQKRIVSREQFDQLSDEARRRAFTVAGEDSADAISTIQDVLTEEIREGTSFRQFEKRMDEALEGSFLGPAHRETVYRTNVQAAFHEGHDHLARDPIVASIFPYQSYDPIDDGRVRDTHLALASLGIDGTNIYHRDDPFWDVWTPPSGFNCRCGTTLLTVESAARRGVREAQEWLRTGVEPRHEFRLASIPFDPDPGFANRGRRVAA